MLGKMGEAGENNMLPIDYQTNDKRFNKLGNK